jgi:hypothetical protein
MHENTFIEMKSRQSDSSVKLGFNRFDARMPVYIKYGDVLISDKDSGISESTLTMDLTRSTTLNTKPSACNLTTLAAVISNRYDGMNVLGLGCGDMMQEQLAYRRGAKSIIGIDFDKGNLRNAKKNLLYNGIEARLYERDLSAPGVLDDINQKSVNAIISNVGAAASGGRAHAKVVRMLDLLPNANVVIMGGYVDPNAWPKSPSSPKRVIEELGKRGYNLSDFFTTTKTYYNAPQFEEHVPAYAFVAVKK